MTVWCVFTTCGGYDKELAKVYKDEFDAKQYILLQSSKDFEPDYEDYVLEEIEVQE
jgi:hypothetical protein